MQKVTFSIDIKAPKEKVWYSLWDEENYRWYDYSISQGRRRYVFCSRAYLREDKIRILLIFIRCGVMPTIPRILIHRR